MNGFYIKELRITGPGMKDASILFEKGLNVINGPSNTGKSFVLRCVDYIFGADTIKEINESKGYTDIYLEIRNFKNDSPTTLLRFFNSKEIYYALSTIDGFNSATAHKLKTKHDADKKDNISMFLLEKIGIKESKFMLKNQSGAKKTLGFRAIVNLSLISETRIISDVDSPIFNKIKTEETYCKSVFRFLLTTIDDVTCEEIEKAEIRKARIEAKLEYITNEIRDLIEEQRVLQRQLDESSFEKVIDIEAYSDEISKIENKIEEKHRLILDKQEEQNQLSLENVEFSLILDRLHTLKEQYRSDLDRLSFLQVGEDCLDQIHISNCPICNSELQEDVFDFETSKDILTASRQEEEKLSLHLLELAKTIETTTKQVEKINFVKGQKVKEIKGHQEEIDDLISRELTPLKNLLGTYLEIENIKNKILNVSDRVVLKNKELVSLREALNQKQPILNYDSNIPSEILNEFMDEILNTLTNWGYKDLRSVTFDDKEQDIVINGQPRKSNGKGYRAFFYTAFAVSFMSFLLSKNRPFTRVLLIDSPITTLKERELRNRKVDADNDMVDVSMQDSLFVSLSKSSSETQIIILENKELPQQVEGCNHIEFTQGRSKGRYGLFPPKNSV